MPIVISAAISAKLAAKSPPVTREEIEQAFATRSGVYLIDDREDHATDPPTRWFIGATDYGRKLKIAFVMRGKELHIKSAYSANAKWITHYKKYHD